MLQFIKIVTEVPSQHIYIYYNVIPNHWKMCTMMTINYVLRNNYDNYINRQTQILCKHKYIAFITYTFNRVRACVFVCTICV